MLVPEFDLSRKGSGAREEVPVPLEDVGAELAVEESADEAMLDEGIAELVVEPAADGDGVATADDCDEGAGADAGELLLQAATASKAARQAAAGARR